MRTIEREEIEAVQMSAARLLQVVTGGNVEIVADTHGELCPALARDEADCNGSTHSLRGATNKAGRRCPLMRYRDERARLTEQLALCGYSQGRSSTHYPVGATLLRLIDPTRVDPKTGQAYQGVSEVLPAIEELSCDGWGNGRHLILRGSMGTVKTHAALCVHFMALWNGLASTYLSNHDLRENARMLASRDDVAVMRARHLVAAWRRAPLLVIDDLGDYPSSEHPRAAGSTGMALQLGDILNGSTQQRVITTNLDRQKMADHCDIGPRAVDRIFGDRRVTCSACRGQAGTMLANQCMIECATCESAGTLTLPTRDVHLHGPSQRARAGR